MSKRDHLPVLCVLGSWSSGTTAVTGYLKNLGAYSCPPHVGTFDPRTPDSMESLEFRNQCASTVDEATFSDIGDRQEFGNKLQDWIIEQSHEAVQNKCSHIVLKHPLSAFLISEIHEACDPKWIVVTRSFEKIENTRKRRKWFHYYGVQGASKVYSALFSSLIQIEATYLTLSFSDFLSRSTVREQLTSYSEIAVHEGKKDKAEEWIR